MNTETGTLMAGRTAMVRHSTCPVFLLSFVLLFCAIAAAEPGLSTHAAKLTGNRMTDLRFAHLTTNDGLSQSTVTEILQDRRGFMRFGTETASIDTMVTPLSCINTTPATLGV